MRNDVNGNTDQYGTRTVTIVTVAGAAYADCDGYGYPAAITSLSGLEDNIKINNGGVASNITVTLSDLDGSLQALYDSNNLQKQDVIVTQILGGNEFTLFKGQVQSPVSFKHSPPSLTFSAGSHVEDCEIGFSPEEGEITDLAASAVGKAWPLCFGNVIRVPAVKITEQLTASCMSRYNVLTYRDLYDLYTASMEFGKAAQRKTAYENDIAMCSDDTDVLSKKTANFAYMINEYRKALSKLSTLKDSLIRSCPDRKTKIQAYVNAISYFRQYCEELIVLQKKDRVLLDLRDSIRFELENFDNMIEDEENKVHGGDDRKLWEWEHEADQLRDQVDNLDVQINALEAEIATLGIVVMEEQRVYTALRKELLGITITEIKFDYGSKFPTGEEITVVINNAKMTGTLGTDSIFTISDCLIPRHTNIPVVGDISMWPMRFELEDSRINLKGMYCLVSTPDGDRVIYVVDQGKDGEKTVCSFNSILLKRDYTHLGLDSDTIILEAAPFIMPGWVSDYTEPDMKDLPNAGWGYDVGDTIYLGTDPIDYYIANLYPSSEILEVFGERTVNGVTKKVPIPMSYYEKDLNWSFASKNVTALKFRTPLTTFVGESWSDTVFVTLRSTICPNGNTADILSWIFTNYTDLTPDDSFSVVSGYLTQYPSHFALLEKKNVIQVAEDIAWQARCALYIHDGVVTIKYLSKQYDSGMTISRSDILANTLEFCLTDTESLVTKLVATWSDSHSKDPYKIILRNNISQYGVFEEEHNFFIYTDPRYVLKSATFWLMRLSNTWRKVKFSTVLTTLGLEVYDTITVDLTSAAFKDYETGVDVAISDTVGGSVTAVVENATYNIQDNTLTYECWIPIIAGKTEQYPLAFPADASMSVTYPTSDDLYTGGLNGDWNVRPCDVGEEYPSDQYEMLYEDNMSFRSEVDYSPLQGEREPFGIPEKTRIDINETDIYDSNTGNTTTLATAMSVETNPLDPDQATNVIAFKDSAYSKNQITGIIAPTRIVYDDQYKSFVPKYSRNKTEIWFGKILTSSVSNGIRTGKVAPVTGDLNNPTVDPEIEVKKVYFGKNTSLKKGDIVMVISRPGDNQTGWGFSMENEVIYNLPGDQSVFDLGTTITATPKDMNES